MSLVNKPKTIPKIKQKIDFDEIYRNIYFKKKIIKNFYGKVVIHYTGNLYPDCDKIKDFDKKFDRSRDLLITCNDCASRKYKKFVKIEKKS